MNRYFMYIQVKARVHAKHRTLIIRQLAPEGKGQTHQGRNDAGRREKEDKEGPQGGENKADDPKPLLGVGL